MTVRHESLYYEDGYGNRYYYWLRPEPPESAMSGLFKAMVAYRKGKGRTRFFRRRKSAKDWCFRLYRTRQDRFLQVQERKKQRALERKMKPKKSPNKLALADKGVDEAMEKLKELDRKEALISTLRKRWTRRLAARLAYAKKLRSTSIEAALVEANPD